MMCFSKIRQRCENHYIFLVIVLVYLVLNLLTLDKYRLVHDDEGVLANAAYLLSQQGPSYIHPILSFNGPYKQMAIFPLSGFAFFSTLAVIGNAIGYGLYQMRLQPLFFSLVSLMLLYIISLELFGEKTRAILAVFFTAFHAKYVDAAHMVRQEAMFITCILGVFLLFLLGLKRGKNSIIYFAAILSGVSISVHANGIFLPLMLCLLLIACRSKCRGRYAAIFCGTVACSLLGALFFVVFDYLPHRGYYWSMFHSTLLNGVTNSVNLLSLTELRSRLFNIWATFFWEPRYHRYMFNFAMLAISVFGVFFYRRRAHSLVLFVLLYLFVVILLLHESQFYFVYTVPFVSMLLSSVLLEFKDRYESGSVKRILVCKSIYSLLIMHILLLGGGLLAHRGYDYDRQVELVKNIVGENGKFISADSYFFGFSNSSDRVSHYLLFQYDLKRLMDEMEVQFFILDNASYSFLDPEKGSNQSISTANISFLKRECEVALTFHEYHPSIVKLSNVGKKVAIYNCKKVVHL